MNIKNIPIPYPNHYKLSNSVTSITNQFIHVQMENSEIRLEFSFKFKLHLFFYNPQS